MKTLVLSALIAGVSLLAMAPVVASAQTKNVVLVHGAFADASSWSKVQAILVKKGYKVTAVEIPLTSLADDVAATRAAIDAQTGPTVLVGHSWGGVVIGEAGDNPKVKSLVYVSAFGPDKGESIGALSEGKPPSEGVKAIRPDDKGFLGIDPAAFPAVFAADLPLDQAQSMAAHQRRINSASFGSPATVAAWHVKPSFYVLTADDQTIPAPVQSFFAGRMKAQITEIKASHAGLISQPEAVAKVIEEAAR